MILMRSAYEKSLIIMLIISDWYKLVLFFKTDPRRVADYYADNQPKLKTVQTRKYSLKRITKTKPVQKHGWYRCTKSDCGQNSVFRCDVQKEIENVKDQVAEHVNNQNDHDKLKKYHKPLLTRSIINALYEAKSQHWSRKNLKVSKYTPKQWPSWKAQEAYWAIQKPKIQN